MGNSPPRRTRALGSSAAMTSYTRSSASSSNSSSSSSSSSAFHSLPGLDLKEAGGKDEFGSINIDLGRPFTFLLGNDAGSNNNELNKNNNNNSSRVNDRDSVLGAFYQYFDEESNEHYLLKIVRTTPHPKTKLPQLALKRGRCKRDGNWQKQNKQPRLPSGCPLLRLLLLLLLLLPLLLVQLFEVELKLLRFPPNHSERANNKNNKKRIIIKTIRIITIIIR